MKYVFGPVPSRRLGQSLGIDPIPLKTCNWNCVYCQLGRTKPLTNLRKAYFPREEILDEVKVSLNTHQPGEIDWVTFVGSGEPTLHSDIGWLIEEIKKITELPVAIITNGSLLYLEQVRQELLTADAVLPSLDAGSEELYRRINRPHPGIDYELYVQGLVEFQQEYHGKLWIEVMLVRGLNDSEGALWPIARLIKRINPDQVHINLPTRPPVETWVLPPDDEGLIRTCAILGEFAHVIHPAQGTFDLSGYEDPLDAIISIITRHPMRQDQIEHCFEDWPADKLQKALAELETSGRAQKIDRYGTQFWSASRSLFPNEIHSWASSPASIQKRRSKGSDE